MQTPARSLDWCQTVDEMTQGSPVAIVYGTRLVTEFLVEYRAYDFSERWDDLIRQVLVRTLRDRREQAWGSSDALRDRIRATTCGALRSRLYTALDWDPKVELPWCQTARVDPQAAWSSPFTTEDVSEMRLALEKLPEQRANVISDFYGDGRNFDQIAANRKLPLRMVKRFLRESLWELRDRCSAVQSERDNVVDERVKSCFRSLEHDLGAFVVESESEEWREFRAHYPVCLDCSTAVASWSRVEALVRAACGHRDRHPPAEELVSLGKDDDRLSYPQYVALMRHLDSCYACGEAVSVLADCGGRPFNEWEVASLAAGPPPPATRPQGTDRSAAEQSASPVARVLERIREILGL